MKREHSSITKRIILATAGCMLMAPSALAHVGINTPSNAVADTLCAGQTYTIEWEVLISHDLQNWDLWYILGGEFGTQVPIVTDLAPGSNAAGSIHTYEWTVPNVPSTDMWIRVRMDNNGTNYQDRQPIPVIAAPSSVASRNAGTNPAAYVGSTAVLGGSFTASVDNALAGQTMSVLFAFDTAVTLTLGGGQTLLALDLGGSGEIFSGGGLLPSGGGGGVDTYSLPIPNNLAYCGLVLNSQAIQFGNPPFVLSNAQDVTVGL